jgi:IS605 OrfB family transposase
MKLTVRIRLMPDGAQAASLAAMTERFNAACDWIAGELFARKLSNKVEVQRLLYHEIRQRFGLSSQTTILCIHRACEAYKRDTAIRPRVRKDPGITHDVRTMSFKGIDTVSLLTLEGRILVPMIVTAYQGQWLGYPKGQCDLVRARDGKWFLVVTVDVPDSSPVDPVDFLGVDLGIANLATDSDGTTHSGKDVQRVRRKHNLQRKRLQRRNTKGSKKKIRRMRDKEARFRRHQIHVISKQIVESARRTGRGIALEDLAGIRQRVTARGGDARNRLGGWAFAQLARFVLYKGRLAGVVVEFIDPAYTSRTCAECGHCERSVCRVTFHHIPIPDRRFSDSEPGPSGSPTVERHGGPQHAGKAGAGDVSKPNAPQGSRGMAKARLLEVQSRSGYSQPHRLC